MNKTLINLYSKYYDVKQYFKSNDKEVVNNLKSITLYNDDGDELMDFNNTHLPNISIKKVCEKIRSKYDGNLYLNMVLNGPPIFNLIIEINDKEDINKLEEYNDVFINSVIPENRILHNLGLLMVTKEEDIFDTSNIIDHYFVYKNERIYRKEGFHILSLKEHEDKLPLNITTMDFETKKINNLFTKC